MGAIPRELVRDFRPELVITLDFFAANSLLVDAWFAENYTLVLHRTELVTTHGELLVYSRNDFGPGLTLAAPNAD